MQQANAGVCTTPFHTFLKAITKMDYENIPRRPNILKDLVDASKLQFKKKK